RIDEETGREHAAPVKVARRAGNARTRRVERDREAEPEADPGVLVLGKNADAVLGQIAAAGKMVRGHQIERLAADDPHIAQFAAAEQHQAETVIIVECRGEPAAARMETALLRPAAARAFVETLHLVPGVKGIG